MALRVRLPLINTVCQFMDNLFSCDPLRHTNKPIIFVARSIYCMRIRGFAPALSLSPCFYPVVPLIAALQQCIVQLGNGMFSGPGAFLVSHQG